MASLILSTLAAWIKVHRDNKILSSSRHAFSKTILSIYMKLAIPSIAQQSVMSIGSLFLQKIVNRSGLEAINGYTIAGSISNFLLIPIISWTTAYETFASQNLGGKEYERAGNGYVEMMRQGGLVCIILSAVTALCSRQLAGLYLRDASSSAYIFAVRYLMVLIPNYFFLLLKYGSDAVFKAHLKVQYFTCSSFIALFVRVLAAEILNQKIGLIALAWAVDIGNLTAYFFCLFIKLHYGWPVLFFQNKCNK